MISMAYKANGHAPRCTSGAVVVALAALGSACASETPPPPESLDVPLSDLRVTASVSSNGNAALFQMSLTTSAFVGLAISPNEGIVIDVPGDSERLLEAREDRAYALVPTTASMFFLRLVRAEGTLSFRVELPPPFTVTAPKVASRGEPLALTWTSNEASPVTIRARAPCLLKPIERGLAKDRGAYTFSPGDLAVGSITTKCVVAFEVERRGTIREPQGTIATSQTRTVTVETQP